MFLAQGHGAVSPVRLETETHKSRVKLYRLLLTKPLGSHIIKFKLKVCISFLKCKLIFFPYTTGFGQKVKTILSSENGHVAAC